MTFTVQKFEEVILVSILQGLEEHVCLKVF
jgi:hypothetical protein